MDKDEFLKEIKSLMKENKRWYDHVLVQSALSKQDDGWKNALTKLVILSKKEKPRIRNQMEYEDFLLTEEVISCEDLIKRLKVLTKGFKVNEYPFSVENPNQIGREEYQSSNSGYFTWPGKLYCIGSGSRSIDTRTLVGYNLPLFADGYHAIKKWIDIHPFQGNGDGRLDKILLFMPNYKAKIEDVNYKRGKLTVTIKSDIPLRDIRCKILCRKDEEEMQESKDFEGSSITIPIKFEPRETDIYLISSKNEILDYYRETPFWHLGKKRLMIDKEEAEVIGKLVKDGEGETLEFKEKVDEPKTKRDLVKTAIAFANTKGGKILIGVSDNAEIIGIDNEIKKTNKSKVKERYVDMVRNGCKKAIEFSTNMHKIDDDTILIINVREGRFKPYATKENDIFIRVGATDRKADPDTELPRILSKSR